MVGAGAYTGGVVREHSPGESFPFFVAGVLGVVPDDVHSDEVFNDGGGVDCPGWNGECVYWFCVYDLVGDVRMRCVVFVY